MNQRLTLALAVAVVAAVAIPIVLPAAVPAAVAGDRDASWTQFGGARQDFRADAGALADAWPADGPKRLWTRELGDGYSGIVVEDGRLYTMYRDADAGEEVVVCLDEETGATVWETRYDADPDEGHVAQFGEGPRATPLISGKRIFTVGVSGVLNALNKKNGKILWSQDLWGDLDGSVLGHGYSSSPIDYGDTVIALVGGEGHAIVAFKKKNGKVAWKAQDFDNSYSTPKLIRLGGRDHLVTYAADKIVGLDPTDGGLDWSLDWANQFRQNVNMPIWTEDDILFFSTPQNGSKGVRLTVENGEVALEELWETRKIQFYHVTSVRDGDWVYGSTGAGDPHFMAAINVKTGDVAWRKRGFPKANVLFADGRLIILDEDGKLYLAKASPEDLEVVSEAQVLDAVSWTVPTVVGTRMYVRDKARIVALDLS